MRNQLSMRSEYNANLHLSMRRPGYQGYTTNKCFAKPRPNLLFRILARVFK